MKGLKSNEYIKYVLESIDTINANVIDTLLSFDKNLPNYLKYNRKFLD